MLFHITVWDDDQQNYFSFNAYLDDIKFGYDIYNGNHFDVIDTEGFMWGYPLSALISIVCISK